MATKSSLVFGLLTAIGVILGTLAVALFALFGHPLRASVVLGAGLCALGVLRGIWPGRPWFASRNRWLDVIAYLVIGVAILTLSPFASEMYING